MRAWSILIFIGYVVFGGVMEFEFTYPEPILGERDGYTTLYMEGGMNMGTPGEPEYPLYCYNIALPPGSEMERVEILEMEAEEIEGKHILYPYQPEMPLTPEYSHGEFVPLKDGFLNRKKPYPEEIIQHVRTGEKGGYPIGTFYICPLRYIPAEGKISVIKRIKVRVHYRENARKVWRKHPRVVNFMAEEVKRLVINPKDVEAYKNALLTAPAGASKLGAGDWEYVIITPPSWRDTWNKLIKWKTRKGVKARCYPTDSIYSNYTGKNNAEKVKNFIIDANNTWGAIWFLIGADLDSIPHVPCYGYVFSIPPQTDKDIASTRYWEDFDDWDKDGDELYCEYDDDGPLDFWADCHVGRICVNNTTEIDSFINRIITYEKEPPAGYQNRILHWTEELFSSDSPGMAYAETLQAFLRRAGVNYLTYIEQYDEKGWFPGDAAALDTLEHGVGWTVVHSHGDYDEVMQGQSDGDDITVSELNTYLDLPVERRFGIHLGICCQSGGYHEVSVCYSESWNFDNYGGVASIFNSEYGWGNDISQGDTTKYNYQRSVGLVFRTVFYCYTKPNDWRIGMAHGHARDAHIRFITDEGSQKWCMIEFNLLGDPEMPVWRDIPQNLYVEVRNWVDGVFHHDTLLKNQTNVCSVYVYDAAKAAVSDAPVVLMDSLNSDFYLVDTTGANGWVVFNVTPTATGTYWLTATNYPHNYIPAALSGPVGVLALETVEFTALSSAGKVILKWKVPSNRRFVGWEIERRRYGSNEWESMVTLGARITSAPETYEWVDEKVKESGVYVYRIKGVKADGREILIARREVYVEAGKYSLNVKRKGDIYTIRFQIPEDKYVKLAVFDIAGRKMGELINEKVSAGIHTVEWRPPSAGVFFVRMEADGKVLGKRILHIE